MDGPSRKRSHTADDNDPPTVKNARHDGPPDTRLDGSTRNSHPNALSSGWSRLFPNDSRTSSPNLNREISSFRSLGTIASFPPSRYQGGLPVTLREPLKVGEFSLDDQRKFHNDARAKKFFDDVANGVPDTRVEFDLRKGYETFAKRDESEKEYLDFILRWIMENRVDLTSIDFVCWRGLMTKLLTTPYENREGWIVAASKCRGTWFLYDFETEAKKLRESQMNEEQREMTYWGYKFEQYVATTQRGGQPDVEAPVNNAEGYCRVVKSKVNEHSLVFAGEVDCLDETTTTSAPAYLELKTSRELANQRQRDNFYRFKALKFWAQSFLLGIPRIICGFRDDEGIVRRLETFQTLRIPHLVREIRDSWSGDVCLRFLNAFLTCVKQHVTSPDPTDVVLFTFEPRKDIVIWQCPNDSPYVFLPKWFIGDSGNGTGDNHQSLKDSSC